MPQTFVVEEVLTMFARGFMQDTKKSLANFFAPIVGTGIATGQYKEYSLKNAFQIPKTVRAIGGDANRLAFESDDAHYNCTPNALEAVIDEHERTLAGEARMPQLKESKIAALLAAAKLAREYEVITKARAALTAVSGKGVWSSDAVDPIDQIDEQIEAIAKATGMFPNRMVLGVSAFRALRANAKIKDELKGSGDMRLSIDKLRERLLIPDIDIRLGTMVYDTTKAGKASSLDFILGTDVFLFIGADNPTEFDPSFMKTFATDGSLIDSVRSYEEGPRREVFATDWTQDVRATSTISGRRLAIT